MNRYARARPASLVPGQDSFFYDRTLERPTLSGAFSVEVSENMGAERALQRQIRERVGAGVESILAGGVAYKSVTITFAGSIQNPRNIDFRAQVGIIIRVGTLPVDVQTVNLTALPGITLPVSIAGKALETAPPGIITAEVSMSDLATGQVLQRAVSPDLGAVQTITLAPTLTGGFTVAGV